MIEPINSGPVPIVSQPSQAQVRPTPAVAPVTAVAQVAQMAAVSQQLPQATTYGPNGQIKTGKARDPRQTGQHATETTDEDDATVPMALQAKDLGWPPATGDSDTPGDKPDRGDYPTDLAGRPVWDRDA